MARIKNYVTDFPARKACWEYKVDFSDERKGEKDTLEVRLRDGGRGYTVTVLGPRGRIKSMRHDFEDVLTRGWLYDKLTALTDFRFMLADLGVSQYAYEDRRYYYA